MRSAYVHEPGQLLEPAPELLERVFDAAKLHGELVALDREHGVVGGAVEVAPEGRQLAAAERPAHAAGVEDDPVADPPLPLDVRVAGGERGRVAEELAQIGLARVGVDLLQERRGRSVHAPKAPAAAEVELERRREAADELAVVVVELRQRPRAEPRAWVVVRAEAVVEEPVVGVAEHDRAAELVDAAKAVRRLRPALDEVAEADEPVDARLGQLGEDGVEPDAVSVHVGEDADEHQARCWTPRSRSMSCSASANSDRSSAIVGRTATAGTIGSQKLKIR